MLADDGGNLFFGQLLAEAKDFGDGNEDIKDKSQQEQNDVGVEEDASDGSAEIGEIFEHGVDDEDEQGDEHKEDGAPQQFVEVVLADELLDFLPDKFLIIVHLERFPEYGLY